MSIDEILYHQGRLALTNQLSVPFSGLDVWLLDNKSQPVFRDEDIGPAELSDWLQQKAGFRKPDQIESQHVKGHLRLIYQRWLPEHHVAGSNSLPMSEKDLDCITKALHLPRCFLLDFASRKNIPLYLKRCEAPATAGLIWQSPPLRDAFMTMVLSYDRSTRTTYAYLGFQSNGSEGKQKLPATPGDQLLTLLSICIAKADDPMLLPALASGLWVDYLQHGNHKRAMALREIQTDIGLMGPYLSQSRVIPKGKQSIDLNTIHGKIVLEHAYLTNGVSEFLTDLFPSTQKALKSFRAPGAAQHQQPNPQTSSFHHSGELDEYVEHMRIRAQAELQHRDRMLSRMNVYFQVLYSLMQQDVARETKRDSSAMKGIALLTMVFLPATAIATIISPFVRLDAHDTHLIMAPQFYVFWAVSAPVTVVVVILWIAWLQRAEIARIVYRNR